MPVARRQLALCPAFTALILEGIPVGIPLDKNGLPSPDGKRLRDAEDVVVIDASPEAVAEGARAMDAIRAASSDAPIVYETTPEQLRVEELRAKQRAKEARRAERDRRSRETKEESRARFSAAVPSPTPTILDDVAQAAHDVFERDLTWATEGSAKP